MALAATFDSLVCHTNYFTGLLTFKYTPKNANYYTRCNIALYTNGTYIALKTIDLGKHATSQRTSYNFLTAAELSTIYSNLPNTDKGILRFTLLTYSDSGYSDQIGDGIYKEITLAIPDDSTTKPTVSMSLSAYNSLPSPYSGLYIQGYSMVNAAIDSTPKYGATITSTAMTVDGNSYYEPHILSRAGRITVTAYAADSRGFVGTTSQDIEVIPYSKPCIRAESGESDIIVARCDSDGNLTDSGTYLKIKARVVFSEVVDPNGTQHNHGGIKFRYRQEGDAYSEWNTILDSEGDEPLLDGRLSVKAGYQVQVVAFDDLYESESITIDVPSEAVYMHKPKGGKGMGLGGYSTGDGRLDVYWKTMARGGLSLVDAKGDEIPLDSTLPIPRGEVAEAWNSDNSECGVYVTNNGILMQMNGTINGDCKVQLSLPFDTGTNPTYRICRDGEWSDWRSFKL